MIWSGSSKDFSPLLVPAKYYVYALSFDLYSEPFYIGKGSGTRAKGHIRNPANKAIARILKLHPDYYITILNYSNNEATVYQLEKFYISKFGKKIDGGVLLNFADGGEDYSSHTKNIEFRKAKSKSYSEKFGKSIFIDGFIFPSKRVASRALNIPRQSFSFLFRVGRAFYTDDISAHAVYLEFMETSLSKYIKIKNRHRKAGRAVYYMGVYYASVTDAANENGITPSRVVARLKSNPNDEYHYVGVDYE